MRCSEELRAADDGNEIVFEEACGDWVCLFNPFAVGTFII